MKSKMPKVKSEKNLDLIVLNSLRDDGAGLVNQPTKLLLSIRILILNRWN
jgi:hypothetical protein